MAPKVKGSKNSSQLLKDLKKVDESEDSVKLHTTLDKDANSYIAPEDLKYYKGANLALTLLAFGIRFYLIYFPSEVVFDEVHFGKFAAYYIERTYFFDLHPPFAKLLIAFVGYIFGFNGKFKFTNIGDSYIDNSVPYIPMRTLSAVLGTLTVPACFLTLQECGFSIPTCALAACLIAFDNAHVTDSRLILLDATLIFAVAASVYCYVRFTKQRNQPFATEWWKWLLLTGVSLSCVISTKYVGVFTFLCIGVAIIWDLWRLLDIKQGLTMRVFIRHFCARFISLIVVPFIIYLGWFYIHFAILTKSGPGDDFMSSEFQETLSESPLTREAKEVNYHDVITLKHKDTQCLLHSHNHQYPLRYDDGRISSQGQQVTCVQNPQDNDLNDQWEILPVSPYEQSSKLGHQVKQGDTFRLRHVGTNGYLLTHDVASPLFPTNEEFTVIDIESGDSTRFNDTLFRFDPQDKRKTNVLKTKASLVKVFHVPTIVTLWTHDDVVLPEWGFGQQEVNGNKKVGDADNYWTIDSIVGLSGPRTFFTPKKVTKLPFLRKWWELQMLMFEHNNKLSSEHPFASEPGTWPASLSGVSFWTDNTNKRQIYFIGNIVGWCFECVCLFSFCLLILLDQITRRREVYILTDKSRSRLYNTTGFFFCGWATHYFLFFLMSRQKFLHHYLPAHLLAALFSASFLEFMFTDNKRPPELSGLSAPLDSKAKETETGNGPTGKILWLPYISTVALVISIIISCFIYFAPFTYGNVSLPAEEVVKRQWFNIKLHYSK
ncbi:unnamed protein product [[Candida] boidinii]|uniref:Dolichyl-phosphate-mannose--protein mannosyltransferase n=1 Tax=Candida boidinii TaxID=5477 RepID=A0A9W6SX81_CANBO|nr:hypothetical protein B5S30_g978 [[Candida] boidinii]OWB81613.1 hypothetical protein B5S33_g232 [[Candida] boidinii]GME66772.1 unnamed protein product [[Candida] boidinii]GME86975.1 unnamed protein product [[Candida] boidinii]GMF98049.1 unnamed protein product [[Candida] boidinii]